MTEGKETDSEHKKRSGVSRREFIAGTVGGVVVGAVVGAATGSLGFPKTVTQTTTETTTAVTTATTTAQPWLPAKWDYTADVVVVGAGDAAMAAAITAHDAGASVIVLEKTTKEYSGGNSKVAGNMFWAPLDATLGAQYIQGMRQGDISDAEVFPVLAQGLQQNLTWIQSLGAMAPQFDSTYAAPPNPSAFGPHTELPGSETYRAYSINSADPNYGGYGQTPGATGGGRLWKLLLDNVVKRGINIMYSTPATDLIQNGNTKEILGVVAKSGGSTINIKANKAVVLACGSYEFDFDMQKWFLPLQPLYGEGTPANTGDGIKMAQKAGAGIWHMKATLGASPNVMIVPDYPIVSADGMNTGIIPISCKANGFIWVDKWGNRYDNEALTPNPSNTYYTTQPPHGLTTSPAHIEHKETQFNWYLADWDRCPSWIIFDDKTRAAGPLMAAPVVQPLPGSMLPAATNQKQTGSAWFGWHTGFTWSSDNSAEIAKGWILKANTISDLAAAIKADPDNRAPYIAYNQGLMDAATLQATVTKYNGYCAAKLDSDFGRAAAYLVPVSTPPYYAVKAWSGTTNQNGGPIRGVDCHVLTPNKQPIPRLYSAGECGSWWGYMYSSGGNLGECMVTGRIAGKNASAETSWS